ncbi:ATPase [Marinobacter salexigens]|uniref:ATPase n=1 Tax=Marinobacter salexigens TaxID=1925763 RepID=A0ABS6A8T3_9GAMM|nr:ATPase [Marinobacter salexigens]MBU2874164.1 ATPase [Marinobacter salexigens]
MSQKNDQQPKKVVIKFSVDCSSSEAAKQLRRSEFEESVKKDSDMYGKKKNNSDS